MKYDERLEFAKKLALEAGGIMRKYFLITDTGWKSDDTPLTQADTEINSLVIRRVAASFPGHSVLGEEESVNNDSKYTWVCDPVDGTMPYSHGLPISTFSLALCEDGVPMLGVVHDPFMKRLFWAAKGTGSYCNDQKIHVNARALSNNALIDLEGYEKSIVPLRESLDIRLFKAGAKTTHLWSAVISATLVSSGQFSGSIFFLDKPEDGAAVKIIVEEAGGKVTSLLGEDQRYDQPTKGFIASNGIIHDELVELVGGKQ